MKLAYNQLRKIATESKENYEILKANSDKYDQRLGPWEDIVADKGYYNFEFYVNTIEELPDWILNEATFERPKTLKLIKDDLSIDTSKVLKAIKLNQVHLPGNELLMIDDVTWIENSCTEELQKMLDEGYRIISVIVQSGQRRPDYVLGRRKPVEVNHGPF